MGASTLTARRNKPGARHLKRRKKISSRRQRKNETKKRRPVTRNRKRRRPKRRSQKKRNLRKISRTTSQSLLRAMRDEEVRCETTPSGFPRIARDCIIVRCARNQCANYLKHRLRDCARKNLYTCGPTNRRRHGCDS